LHQQTAASTTVLLTWDIDTLFFGGHFMLRMILGKAKRIPHTSTTGRSGFTLIETLLAVGILLILSFIIYQGFVATIKYSWNTNRFEKSVVANAGTVNQKLAGSLGATPTPSVGIYLSWNVGGAAKAKVLGGQKYSAVTTVASINIGAADAKYQESASLASTHQYGFSYLPMRCPNDGNQLLWFTNGTNYFLVCPVNDYTLDMGAI
jgi:prepilin-type N-terminal cleavage/methylation domain-containing protein